MSVKALTWAWAQDIPSATKIVLMALADHADDDGVCWPGVRGVAAKCGYNVRTVQRHLSRLIRLGLLTRLERIRADGSHTSNVFVLRMHPNSAQIVGRVVTELSGSGGPETTRVVALESPGGGPSVTPRTVIEPSLEPSDNGPPAGGFAPTLPAFEKKIRETKNINGRVAVLVDFIRAHAPHYATAGLGGHAAGFLRELGGDGSRALALLVRALAARPNGDLFSYAQAIARKEGRGEPIESAESIAAAKRDYERRVGKHPC